MTRTITTVAELEALPIGSVVMFGSEISAIAFVRQAHVWLETGRSFAQDSYDLIDVFKSLTVLHEPGRLPERMETK